MKTNTTDNMESNIEYQKRYERAQKRVKDIKGFYIHLVVYCVIIPGIIFFNLKYTPQFKWFWFSLLGWGIGLFFHWFGIFGVNFLGFGKDWESRKIEEYMNEKNQ